MRSSHPAPRAPAERPSIKSGGFASAEARTSTPAAALASLGLRALKSRGQNFLVQPSIADRIVDALEVGAGDEVIEIGPGLGILSERLAALSLRRLHLVELDERLATRLQHRFSTDPRVTVTNRDFLAIKLGEIATSPRVKVIGNLPFNAASAILERLCIERAMIERMVLMFQREVADRIRSRPGDPSYGALSVYTALYWNINDYFRVGAGNFFPRPKVDAEVLILLPRAHPPFEIAEETSVLAAIRASFSAPRKMLRNAISGGLKVDSQDAAALLEAAGIDPCARAATLAVEDFVRLARKLRQRQTETVRDA